MLLGCCGSYMDPEKARRRAAKLEEKRINEQIEKDLEADNKKRQNEHRILLLGCGEAGKSTFIKQMRIIYSPGFTDEEKLDYKKNIASNVMSAIHMLLTNMTFDEEDELHADPDLHNAATRVGRQLDLMPSKVLEIADDIKALWESSPIQRAYSRRNQYQLVECARYFLNRVHKVMAEDYEPNNQDIVQARVKTKGILEYTFKMKQQDRGQKKQTLIMIDVGGQRNERRKWIHCFDNVLLLIFLTAVSEYDQVLAEDDATNRVQESLNLFKTILNYHWFESTNIVLFLNKKDLLEEKVKSGKSPVSAYFRDFQGPDNDYSAVITYFSDLFINSNPNPKDRKVFAHETCATDTDNVLRVYAVVQHTIYEAILKSILIT